ncbi:MAG: hypothetical protein WC374_02420 [Phycisphaerae bacterium]|jgi:hypothetical protein
MTTTLNGQSLFDERTLKIEIAGTSRESHRRKIAGLDGEIAIDLGARGRTIKQTGSLRAASKAALLDRIGAIGDYMDGYTYTLQSDGQTFDNVRIDSFKTNNERPGGAGLIIDYEIIYTQLTVD